jgi:hypothetical protein
MTPVVDIMGRNQHLPILRRELLSRTPGGSSYTAPASRSGNVCDNAAMESFFAMPGLSGFGFDPPRARITPRRIDLS